MVRIDIRFAPALVALMVAVGTPAAAEDSNWLGSVGDFVLNGLGPARTMDDIRREELRPDDAAAPVSKHDPAPPKLVMPAAPEPVPPAATPMVAPEPAASAAAVVAAPVVAAPVPVAPLAKKVEPKPAASTPVALPVPEARPKPAVPVAVRVPTPPPEPLTSRIAATATLDQAVKLGGSADIYTRQPKKPVRN